MSRKPSIGIVGAGLTGLCLAQSIRRHGIRPFLLDKGRSPGGRLATTDRCGTPVDYGPGWFHTDDAEAIPEMQEALRTLVAEPVDTIELPDSVRSRLPETGRIRSWRLPGGIRTLAERLADSLDISPSHHVRRIDRTPAGWLISGTVSSDQDRAFVRQASALVLTQPWPQIRELLEASGLADAADSSKAVDDRLYERNMVLIVESEDFPQRPGPPWQVDFDGAGPIRSVRWRKPVGAGHGTILTIFADPAWSRTHWDETDDSVRKLIIEALHAKFGPGFQVAVARQHRWKYARLADPATGNPAPMIISADPLAIAAGEAFGVTPASPSGLLSSQVSARLAATILQEWASGLSGGS